jgi:hypothetical protein
MLRVVSTDAFNGHERATAASPYGVGHVDFIRIRPQRAAFDPEIIWRLDMAYHAVRYRLGLKDAENSWDASLLMFRMSSVVKISGATRPSH